MPAFPASPTPHAYRRPATGHQFNIYEDEEPEVDQETDQDSENDDSEQLTTAELENNHALARCAGAALDNAVDYYDQVEVTGVLRQYVIEMAVDRKPTYEACFQAESRAALALQKPDYRYMTPWGRVTDIRDRANIRRALELTCIDFCQRRGHAVPQDLLANHHNESYMSQYRRIQAFFDRIWMGEHRVKLFSLPAWTKGFGRWRVPGNSIRGEELYHGCQHINGSVMFFGLLEQEKQVAATMKSWRSRRGRSGSELA